MIPKERALVVVPHKQTRFWWQTPWILRCDDTAYAGYWDHWFRRRCKRLSTYSVDGKNYCSQHGPKRKGYWCEKCGGSVARGQKICWLCGGVSAKRRWSKTTDNPIFYRRSNIRGDLLHMDKILERVDELRNNQNPLAAGREALFTQVAAIEVAVKDYEDLQNGNVKNPEGAPIFSKKEDLMFLTTMAEKVGMTYSRVVNAEAKYAITATELAKTKDGLVMLLHSIIDTFVPPGQKDEAYALVEKHYGVESRQITSGANPKLTA